MLSLSESCRRPAWPKLLALLVLVGLTAALRQDQTSGTEELALGELAAPSLAKLGAKGPAANLSRPVRVKRQAFLSCPSKPASSRSSRMRAILALYSPRSRQDVSISQGRREWAEADVERLLQAGLDLSKPTLIYTHGYFQNIRAPWLQRARARFDELYPVEAGAEPDYNLLLFDWSSYGQRAYNSAASFVPYLGKVLSLFLSMLSSRYGYDLARVHIISYSLSTHIAGLAGRKLGPTSRLGQITALDPTGVCFHQATSFSDKFALRPTDAKLVVAKHYDMGRLGARRPIGAVDIFVNGGSDQPAMLARGLTGSQLMSSPGGLTSHTRASEHEVEPFDGQCHELAYACRSHEAFLAGECADCGPTGSRCYLMNSLAPFQLRPKTATEPARPQYKPNTKMFLTTGRTGFCLHHYQLLAKLAPNASASLRRALEEGALGLGLGSDEWFAPSNELAVDQFTALLTFKRRIDPLPSELKLRLGDQLSEADLSKVLKHVEVKYMSNHSARERARRSARFCFRPSRKSLVKC